MKPFWTSMIVACALAGGGFYWWKQQPGGGATTEAKGGAAEGKGDKTAKKGGRRGGGPVSVRIIEAKRMPMPVVIDAVGTVESEHTVAVRPQTSGTLEAVLFKEGDSVRQGQVLFRIDSRPMRNALEQAQAAVTRDEAQLAQAKAQEGRLKPLLDKDYITRNEYDIATTQMKALEATVSANRAAVEQAKLALSYAQIAAPLSGRTGSLSVKAGNLVTAGTGGSALVMINSTKPISVSLNVPQRHLEALKTYWGKPDLKVLISPDPAAPAVAEGQLVFIDNAVNTQTGTILIKARVKNEREELWPGQFVAGRIVLRIDPEAIVLHESVVQPGQDRPFVFVVRDGKAAMQEVVVDRQIGDQVVIAKGLKGDEQIIAEVPPQLEVGSVVQIRKPGEGKGEKGKGGKGEGKAQGKEERKDEPAKEGKS